ncbi:MAG: ATP-binding protein [Sedimentisphaerales bacterium]|nr:ATP-binding protein [Sedimentisphaerales bacterium]
MLVFQDYTADNTSMLKRRIEKSITENLKHFPAIGLVGPRQSGKTTLAKLIAEKWPGPVTYLDLENPQDFEKLDNSQLYLEQFKKHLVILDEAQRKGELFPLLRSLIDKDKRPGRFMILGSASPSLKRQASESLAGRIAYHELSPFTLDEAGVSDANLNKLWLRGGYPQSYLADSDKIATVWMQNFIQTHLERDLPALGIRVPSTTLLRFWTMLAHCNGQLWNAAKLADSLGVDSKTTRRYLDILEDSFMIKQLQPFFANTKKRLVKSPKIYIRDTGLLHTLLKIQSFDDLTANPALGSSWEGFCIEQIIALKPSNFDTYFYRTQAAAEIDLVLTKGLKTEIAVEIKYSLTPKITKSTANAIAELKPQKTWIVYPGKESYPIRKNVWTLPVTNLNKIFE